MPTTRSKSILIVDDAAENLSVLCDLLEPLYLVRAARSGDKALQIAATFPHPDLILLDVMMPGMDGYEVLRHLRADPATCAIPVIFVTSMDSAAEELHGLEVGAVDYITKPIVPPLVLARVATQLELKTARDLLSNQNANLEAEVARRLAENEQVQEVCIRALARLAETRDPETGNHILRTQGYVRSLALQLQSHPRFANVLTDQYIHLLARSAPLHDIGKVGIPDYILLKPGSLTREEWEIMKTHAQIGADSIAHAEQDIAEPLEFLRLAKEIASGHHEKWNGSGYPKGLAGDAIPISARIMALADVFDALITKRCYKDALSFDESREIILTGRGAHFDPDIVDAFLVCYDEFLAIAKRYSDSQSELESAA